MKLSKKIGTFPAHVLSKTAKVNSSETTAFIQLELIIKYPFLIPIQINGRKIIWKGWYGLGSLGKTLKFLKATGASNIEEDPTNFELIGSKQFEIDLEEVECSDLETHGTYATRLFVTNIRSMEK